MNPNRFVVYKVRIRQHSFCAVARKKNKHPSRPLQRLAFLEDTHTGIVAVYIALFDLCFLHEILLLINTFDFHSFAPSI